MPGNYVVLDFEAGDQHAVTNHGPIALQPIYDKLLEKIIHSLILCHLKDRL